MTKLRIAWLGALILFGQDLSDTTYFRATINADIAYYASFFA
jgi:hypothetical protein